MTPIRLFLAFACTAALLLAGCSSSDDTSGTTSGGTDGTTGGPTSGATTGPVVNGTVEKRECTSAAGGSGSGFVGAGGQYVGGCPFGAATDKDTILLTATLPSGCDPYQTPPGGGNTDAKKATVGEKYPSGTAYAMFCGPGGVQLKGDIELQAA
ncbi:MAG: hypothetical protein ABR562_02995 [Thermoplasmatota archaeon]|nr:hypothetical protein [Halobacteriales archaeon]